MKLSLKIPDEFPKGYRMSRKSRETRRVIAYLAGIGVLFVVGACISFLQDYQQIREERYRLASSTGKVLLQTIIATRQWNAAHGGVYAPVTASFPPNPYLDVPGRDVRTTGGLLLTKINPAYMTRLIAERMEKEGYRIHLTSLRPIRPGNEPKDPWERSALEKFQKGSLLEQGLTGPAGNQVFRYMEPLMAKEGCLECHARQGYKLGEIRGGISISFPYEVFEQSIRRATRHAVFTHLSFLGTALVILLLLGRRLVRLVENLQESQRKILTLEGILPICASCKKIRKEGASAADPAAWIPVDSYLTGHSGAKFSHGICPECAKTLYGWSEPEPPPDA
jgi:hypothetical protein